MALVVSSCSPDDANSVIAKNQPVKVISVRTNVAEPIRRFPGRVAASETANIASKVAGQVKNVFVEAGDEVKAGDILLELDQTDYQLNYDQALANYTLAKVSFDRVDASRRKNIATQADFDSAKANVDKASVGLQQAKNQLSDTRVKAPFAGTVVRVNTQHYDFIGAAQPLVYLQSVDNIDVTFQVPSDLVAKLNRDANQAKVNVVFDAISDTPFAATVRKFSADSDRATRSFDVTLTLKAPPQNEGLLLPGMDATVMLDLSLLSPVRFLTVPSHVVFEQAGNTYVWTVVDQTVHKTQVSLGSFVGDEVTVLEGLKAGDTVVAAGIHKLTQGQTVAIWSAE
nr:efflux RND transporter periplasmic adaptor subunit [Reinekea sp. G2M2-21]